MEERTFPRIESCKKTTAVVYHFTIRQTERWKTWADISIEEWNGGGSIKIVSDYGSYSHIWTATGPGHFRSFLIGLDWDYFFSKTMDGRHKTIDVEQTVRSIRDDILKARLERAITKEVARNLWTELDGLDLDFLGEDKESVFYNSIYRDTDLMEELYGGDGHALPVVTRLKSEPAGFWAVIWPHVVDFWKKELADEDGRRVGSAPIGSAPTG